MPSFQDFTIFLLRISLGWYFFYAGLVKLLDPTWTAKSFLLHASMFPDFYAWFAQPAILPFTDVLNSWGLTLIGLALIYGVGVRIAVVGGGMMMVLYYFPHENTHSLVVDDHVIMLLGLLLCAQHNAGSVWGMKDILMNTQTVKNSPLLQKIIS